MKIESDVEKRTLLLSTNIYPISTPSSYSIDSEHLGLVLKGQHFYRKWILWQPFSVFVIFTPEERGSAISDNFTSYS